MPTRFGAGALFMSRFKPSPGRTTTARPPVAPAQSSKPTPAPASLLLTPVAVETITATTAPEEIKDPAWRAAILNTTRQMAFLFTLGFIYFRFSFVHEFIAGHFWIDFHILLILGGLSMLACLASGQLLVGISHTSVKIWFGFFICLCFATVFSTWRGNSIGVLSAYGRTNMPLLLLIPAVAVTGQDIKKVMRVIGFAGASAILIGMMSDDFRSGRLEIQTAAGTIQNSNDFAALIILVLPVIAYTAFERGRNIFFKVAGIGVMACGAVELLGTGSRGGLVAVIAMALYLFVRGSAKLRFGLVFGVPVLIAAVLPFAPSSAVHRMTSLFSSQDETEEAAESREARKALFNASLDITFHHPLFGVGPGEFEDYQGGIAASQGQRGLWHETHNGYTQISSECGIPAWGFFVAGIFLTFRSLRRATVADVPGISPIAKTLSVMLIGYSVCLIFLAQGYSFVPPVLCGISVAIDRLIQQRQLLPSNALSSRAA